MSATTAAPVMRAIAFTGSGRAELVDWPWDPAPARADELVGRTLVTLASPGTELNGYLAERAEPALSGYAAIIEVEQVGSDVRDVRPGERVFCMASHASRARCSRAAAVPVPAGLDPAIAVFCRLMGVGWSTLSTAAARPPERVLVTGLGPVGNLAAQVFAAAGYEVTAVDPVHARRELAIQHGLWDVRAAAEPDLADRLALAVECSGHERAVLDCCRVVRRGGEVALVGVPWRKRTDLAAFDLLHAVFHRYVHLRSGWEWEVPFAPADFRNGSIIGNWAGALRWLADGRVQVGGLASMVPPEDAQRAWQEMLAQDGAPTRVFDWR
jgi:threonine dehydrogenase-like Zn-dependent dehydrogenase